MSYLKNPEWCFRHQENGNGICPDCADKTALNDLRAQLLAAQERAEKAEAENNTLRTDGGIWDKSVYKARADALAAQVTNLEEENRLVSEQRDSMAKKLDDADERADALAAQVEAMRPVVEAAIRGDADGYGIKACRKISESITSMDAALSALKSKENAAKSCEPHGCLVCEQGRHADCVNAMCPCSAKENDAKEGI